MKLDAHFFEQHELNASDRFIESRHEKSNGKKVEKYK